MIKFLCQQLIIILQNLTIALTIFFVRIHILLCAKLCLSYLFFGICFWETLKLLKNFSILTVGFMENILSPFYNMVNRGKSEVN